jgi:hypothetical protein
LTGYKSWYNPAIIHLPNAVLTQAANLTGSFFPIIRHDRFLAKRFSRIFPIMLTTTGKRDLKIIMTRYLFLNNFAWVGLTAFQQTTQDIVRPQPCLQHRQAQVPSASKPITPIANVVLPCKNATGVSL